MAKASKFRTDLEVFGVPRDDPGWIYVVRNGRLIKVGKSKNPHRRIFVQARTWIPDLEVIGIKPFWNVSKAERTIHEGLTHYWYDREWFSFGDDPFGEVFTEGFRQFYDEDRDMNSVEFIYWINGSGMAEFLIERKRQGLSLPEWFRQESWHKRT